MQFLTGTAVFYLILNWLLSEKLEEMRKKSVDDPLVKVIEEKRKNLLKTSAALGLFYSVAGVFVNGLYASVVLGIVFFILFIDIGLFTCMGAAFLSITLIWVLSIPLQLLIASL